MRRVVVVLALLMVVLPIAASADIIANNKYGSISFTPSGIVSVGIQVLSFGPIAVTKGALGSLNFSTGPCLSGCNSSGIPTGTTIGSTAIFSSAGSVFDIVCKQKLCGGSGTALFTGTFTGNVTLTEIGSNPKNPIFTLSGTIEGVLASGMTVTGTTDQTIYAFSGQLSRGIAHIQNGKTQLTVPEPGTLGLMGTGLVGIAGMLRRKIFSA